MSEKLLPCPFCGGEAEISDTGVFWLRCGACDAESSCHDTEAAAIEAWNRRIGVAPHTREPGADVLLAALRDCTCPRPANNEPDDLTIGECFDKKQCGCQNGLALSVSDMAPSTAICAVSPPSPDTVREKDRADLAEKHLNQIYDYLGCCRSGSAVICTIKEREAALSSAPVAGEVTDEMVEAGAIGLDADLFARDKYYDHPNVVAKRKEALFTSRLVLEAAHSRNEREGL